MKLDVTIDDKTHCIEIPPGMPEQAESFFRKMDADMAHGWQMGPEFIEAPDARQRCQIAANKLLTAVSGGNTLMMQLMASYILKHLPGVRQVDIDTSGEMLNTDFRFGEGARPTARLSAADARARADQDVSQPYKVGKSYRFAVYDRTTGQWVESPHVDTEDRANQLRNEAHARLIEHLTHG
jgi:hypothetical protein